MMFLNHYPTPLFFLFRHRDLCEFGGHLVLHILEETPPNGTSTHSQIKQIISRI